MRLVGEGLAYIAIGLSGGLLLIVMITYVAEKTSRHGWSLLNPSKWRGKRRAKKRARKLLLHHLDPLQREDFLKNGGFNIVIDTGIIRITSHPQRVYRYDVDGSPMFVNGLEPYRKKHYRFPAEDLMLSKKLLLETENPWMCYEYTTRHHPKIDMRYVPAQYHLSPAQRSHRDLIRGL